MELENILRKVAKIMRSPFDLTRRTFLKIAGAGVLSSQFPISFKGISKAHASEQQPYNYAFPHFVESADWATGITITNPNPESANLILEAYDIESNLLNDKIVNLAPNASLSDRVKNILDIQGPGSILIQSDQPLIGQETFTSLVEGNSYGNMASLLLSQENDTTIYFPHIASNNNWATGLAFCNPNDLDTIVNLEMRDISGVRKGEAQVHVPAYSQAPAKLAKDLFGDGSPLGFSGYVRAESEQPINGLEIFINSPKGIAGLSAIPHKKLSKNLYFPHFASSNMWWSGIGICSPNNQQALLNFKAYDPQGNLKSTAQKTVGANAQLTPELIKNLFSDLNIGKGWIHVESNVPIAGLEVFGDNTGGIAGLSACNELSKELYFPKVVEEKDLYSEANPDTRTGFSFVNPNNEKANIIASAYDNEGSLIHTKNIIVNPKEAKPQMSSELFPNLKEGYVKLSSDKEITAMQLYMDPNSNISGTLATRTVKEPAVSSLEDILIGGIIAGAELTFYDRYKNYIDSDYTDSEGKFSIPDLAARLRIEKSGYHTRETNIFHDNIYNLISSFDMNNFDTIFRGGVNEFHIQRWLKEKEGGQNPKWYIDLNTDWCDVSKISQSWIDRAGGTIEDKLTKLPIDIVKNPHIEIGYNPPIHYGGFSGTAPRPDEGWIWVKWTRGPPHLSDLGLGAHIEFGLNDTDLSLGMNIAAGIILLKENVAQKVYTQEFGQVLGARMDTYVGYPSAFASGSPHNDYTTFDKNAFKI